MSDGTGIASTSIRPLAPDRALGMMAAKMHYVCDGQYYTTGGFTDFVEGVAAHFGRTELLVPVTPATAERVQNLRKIECQGYTIHPLPPWTNRTALAWLFRHFLRRKARRVFADCDVLNFMMFSMNALMVVPEMRAMQKPLSYVLAGEAYYPRKELTGLRNKIIQQMESTLRRDLTFVYGAHLVGIHHLDPAKSVALYSSSFHESDLRPEPNQPPAPGEPIQLIFLGRIDGMKGVDILLRALAELGEQRSRFHLNVVGDGQARSDREQLAHQLGITDSVTFHGYVPHGQRWQALMSSAHALSFVSLHEGAPKVVTEALRFGMPVLASRVGAIPTVIKEGINGWLVEPNQVEPTSQALRTMLDLDSDAWIAMSRANLELAKQYTVERDAYFTVRTLLGRGLLQSSACD